MTPDEAPSAEQFMAGFGQGGLPIPPAKKLAVVACMDARLDPALALGLEAGDAHVIRNAGGVVTDDVIRSLVISQRLLGTEEIAVIHHTDCSMVRFTDAELKGQIEAETGIRPSFVFENFADAEADIVQSLNRIRVNPFLPHKDKLRGYLFEVETGKLREVA